MYLVKPLLTAGRPKHKLLGLVLLLLASRVVVLRDYFSCAEAKILLCASPRSAGGVRAPRLCAWVRSRRRDLVKATAHQAAHKTSIHTEGFTGNNSTTEWNYMAP